MAITRAKKNLWIADCSEKAKSMRVRSYSIVVTRPDPVLFQGVLVECIMSYLGDMCTNHNILDVCLDDQDLSPKQWQGYLPIGPNAKLAQSLFVRNIDSQRNINNWFFGIPLSN